MLLLPVFIINIIIIIIISMIIIKTITIKKVSSLDLISTTCYRKTSQKGGFSNIYNLPFFPKSRLDFKRALRKRFRVEDSESGVLRACGVLHGVRVICWKSA